MKWPATLAMLTCLCAPAWAEFPAPENLAELRIVCEIGDPALAQLRAHGLVVLPESAGTDLYDCYGQLGSSDVPVYVTADAMLYAWATVAPDMSAHGTCRAEEERLRPLLEGMVARCERLDPDWRDADLRADAVLLAAARMIFPKEHIVGEERWTPPEPIADEVAALIQATPQVPRRTVPGDEYRYFSHRSQWTSFLTAARLLDEATAAFGPRRLALLALVMRDGEGLAEQYAELAALRERAYGPTADLMLPDVLAACDAAWGEGWGLAATANMQPLQQVLVRQPYVGRTPGLLGTRTSPQPPRLTHDGPPVLDQPLPARYADWQHVVEPLFQRPEGLPAFAQGPAWHAKQVNCFMVSWAQVVRNDEADEGVEPKHAVGLPGQGLVEPLPEFFRRIASTVKPPPEKTVPPESKWFAYASDQHLAAKAETFARCAEDQLAGRDTSWALDEIRGFGAWLHEIGFRSQSSTEGADNPAFIADGDPGAALDIATGPLYPIVAMVELEGRWLGAVGYVSGFHQRPSIAGGAMADQLWVPQHDEHGPLGVWPQWADGLYAAREPWQEQTAARLSEIEQMLGRDEVDVATAATDELVAGHPRDAAAPLATLMLGRWLVGAEEIERAVEVLESAEGMYGCQARTEALELAKKLRETLEERRRSEQAAEEFAAALTATAPREGLTAAQDLERQNSRALMLLEGGSSGYQSADQEGGGANLRRLIAECPQSGYVPWAELQLLRLREDWPPWWQGRIEAQQRRAGLLALAEKYRGSIIGYAARVEAADALRSMGRRRAAWDEAVALMDYEPPDPDPWPLSAERYEKAYRHMLTPGGFVGDLGRVLARAGERLLLDALLSGDLDTAYELEPTVRKVYHRSSGFGDVFAYLDWFKDEPDALRDLARAHDFLLDHDQVPWPSKREQIERATRVADAHPGTKVAAAALYWGVRFTYPDDWDTEDVSADRETLRDRLAREYPHSLEAQMDRVTQLQQEGKREEALTLANRLREQYPADTRDGRESYPRTLMTWLPEPTREDRPPDRVQALGEHRLKQYRDIYGDLLTEAGIGEQFFRERNTEDDSLPWTVFHALVERLPDRELEVLRCWAADRHHLDADDLAILKRHRDEPMATDLLLRYGRQEDLVQVVAAGPEAYGFDEGVERLQASLQANMAIQGGPRRSLSGALNLYRAIASRYRGTPVEPLVLAAVVGVYVAAERPEQAADYADIALPLVEEGRPLREHLVKAAAGARARAAAKTLDLERLWSAPVAWYPCATREHWGSRFDDGGDLAPMMLAGDSIYLRGLTDRGAPGLVCLDASDGAVRWRAGAGGVISLALVGQSVIAGTNDGQVVCLGAADGAEVWRRSLGTGQKDAVYLSAGDRAVIACWTQGLLSALDPASGEVLWRLDAWPAAAEPAIAGEVCYAWERDGYLVARRTTDGSEVWRFDWRQVYEEEYPGGQVWREGRFLTPLLVGDRLITGSSVGGQIVALGATTGELLWKRSGHIPKDHGAGLLLSGPDEVLISPGGKSTACAAADGNVRWTVTEPHPLGGLGARGGSLVVLPAWGSCAIVDPALGQVVAALPGVTATKSVAALSENAHLIIFAAAEDEVVAWRVPTDALTGQGDAGQ